MDWRLDLDDLPRHIDVRATPAVERGALMSSVQYTPHAAFKMRVRRISRGEVLAALAHPDTCVPGRFGRTVVRSRVRGRLLRIVYDVQRTGVVVVSVAVCGERTSGKGNANDEEMNRDYGNTRTA